MRSLLILTAFSIFAIGLVMIFSTTSAEILDHDLDKSTSHALIKQLWYAAAGLALAYIIWKAGYQNILRLSPGLLAFFSLLLVLVLIPGIGREVNGSKRWLQLAGFSFQPSEFVKYLVPAFFIHRILEKKDESLSFKDFIKFAGLLCIPLFLILIEPNNGTAAVVGAMITVLCFLTKVPLKFWAWPLIGLMVFGAVFAIQLPYFSGRLKVYMHPELDIKGRGHQPYQAKIAAGSGQMWGKGPGNSLQKLSYLPEAQNDYIAAIYAEEFGFFGIFTLIGLYAFLAYLGFNIAIHSQDPGGFYLAASITFLMCFQAFLNLGVVSGLLPTTGLNLPLFSQGGSSLMANACGIALLISINAKERILHA